jgi:hypothetical protein
MGGRTIIHGGMIDGGEGRGVEVRVRGGENGGMMMGIEMTREDGGEIIRAMMSGRNGGIRVGESQGTLSWMTNGGDRGGNATSRTSRTMNGDIAVKSITRNPGNVGKDIIVDGETTQMTTYVNVGGNTDRLQNVKTETEILPLSTKATDIEDIPIVDVNHPPHLLLDFTHHPENIPIRREIPADLPNQSAPILPPMAPNLSVPKAAAE